MLFYGTYSACRTFCQTQPSSYNVDQVTAGTAPDQMFQVNLVRNSTTEARATLEIVPASPAASQGVDDALRFLQNIGHDLNIPTLLHTIEEAMQLPVSDDPHYRAAWRMILSGALETVQRLQRTQVA